MRKEIIGNATLYLGDCRELAPTLPIPDAVVCDPPYGMAFRSNYRTEKYDSLKNDQTAEMLRWACGLSPNHSTYCFGRWDNLGEIPKPKSVITWVKNNWSMGDLNHEHARQTELIFFYPGHAHDWPSGRPTDVVEAARSENKFHPTEKPITLMERIVSFTRGVVFDPFMGSGSTAVAAMKLGREFIGIEIEPKYFDVACRRIEKEIMNPRLFTAAPSWAPAQSRLAL